MLASIISSTGALVELQVPCLSDSVLAHVLDYIYTGALPCTQSHEQYSNLFTAACYLKMDNLRRRLETQAKQLQLSGSYNGASLESTWEDATSSRSLSGQTLQGINTDSCGQITIVPSWKLPKSIPVMVDMCGVSRKATEVQQYQVHSACPANPESWLQGTEMQTGAAENKRSSAKQGALKRIEANQQLCLVATSEPEEAQTLRGNEQIHYASGCGDNVTSPSSPHPSCGAVPVIRHSSTAAVAEAYKVPNYHPPFEEISTQLSSYNGTQSFDCCSSSGDHIGHSFKSAEGQPHPATGSEEPATGSVFKYEGVSNTEERKEQHTYLSRCVTDTDKLSSRPCLHTTEKNTEGPAFVQHEDDGENSQLCATSTVQMDNMCDPSESLVEQSYHAHLHYHCLHPEDTLLSHRTSDEKHTHPGLSGKASDEDEEGLFSNAAQHFTPVDQVLLLDISTKPPELLISYSYGEQGDWGLLGQDTSGNQREGEAAGTAADNRKGGLEDKKVDVESIDKTSETLGDRSKDPDGDEENYTLKFTPSCMPDSLQAPTSSFCIPPTISANMPTVLSPQLSNHHSFQCSMCHRSFSQRGSLNRHMRSHLGIRPFPCPRCPMTFSRQYRVSEHMRVHQRCVLGNDFQKLRASST